MRNDFTTLKYGAPVEDAHLLVSHTLQLRRET
jgi:hypothetical protein